eukprot:5614706-Pleurochrysis_carterae.AAC.1
MQSVALPRATNDGGALAMASASADRDGPSRSASVLRCHVAVRMQARRDARAAGTRVRLGRACGWDA